MKFTDLPEVGHIGYIVKSADAVAALYDPRDVRVYDFVPTRAWAYGKEITDCRFRIALYSPSEGAKLEFVEFVSGTGTPHKEFLESNGTDIHHIAYYVSNYDEVREFFDSTEGAQITFEAEIEDNVMGKRSSFYVTYPGFPGTIEISKRPTKL